MPAIEYRARFISHLDAYDLTSGKSVWWVNGLASEMKSVPVLDGDTIYINGYNSQFNDPGKHIEIPSFAGALAKYDINHDGGLQQSELPEGPMRAFFRSKIPTRTENRTEPNGKPLSRR